MFPYQLNTSSNLFLSHKSIFMYINSGSAMAVIGFPFRKWHGVKASKSFTSEDISDIGREFKAVFI